MHFVQAVSGCVGKVLTWNNYCYRANLASSRSLGLTLHNLQIKILIIIISLFAYRLWAGVSNEHKATLRAKPPNRRLQLHTSLTPATTTTKTYLQNYKKYPHYHYFTTTRIVCALLLVLLAVATSTRQLDVSFLRLHIHCENLNEISIKLTPSRYLQFKSVNLALRISRHRQNCTALFFFVLLLLFPHIYSHKPFQYFAIVA